MVILIILATVTISAVFDENGLIKQAQKTKESAENFVQGEDEEMNKLLQEYANMMEEDAEIPEPEKDSTPPVVTVTAGGTTTNSITVSVQAVDNESGMVSNPKYTYYIKKTSEGDGSYQAKATSVTEASYTFTGLEQETSYDVKVEVNGDNAGNVGAGYLPNQITGKLQGEVTIGEISWSSGKASVTVSTNTEMQIQYQVDSTSGSGKNISNGGTVSNLEHSQTVYARLTDGTNYGDYASASIVDGIAPTVRSITTGTITENSIQVTVSASDGQSGLATSNTYKYYLNGILKRTQTSNSYTFTGLNPGTQYTIKVEAFDKAGLKGEKSITASTKKIPTVQEKLKEGDYVNYKDAKGITRTCVVLYDNSSSYGIQIITMDTVEDVSLGNDNNFTTCINSYNNAISTLNSRAETYNNSIYSSTARSVGSVPNNPSKDDSGYYTRSDSWFSSYNGKIKNADTNYEADYNKMLTINGGIHKINGTYWLASRSINSDSNSIYFYMRLVFEYAGLDNTSICFVKSYTTNNYSTKNRS